MGREESFEVLRALKTMRSFVTLTRSTLMGVAILLLCAGAQAFTTSVRQGSNGTVVNFTVNDSSCASFNAAGPVAGRTVLGCATEPLVVGSGVVLALPTGVVYHGVVTATDAPIATTAHTPSELPPVGIAPTSYGALAGIVASGGGTGATTSVTVTDAFGTATPEQYEAMATIFGLILCALVMVWGVKQIHAFFQNPSEF